MPASAPSPSCRSIRQSHHESINTENRTATINPTPKSSFRRFPCVNPKTAIGWPQAQEPQKEEDPDATSHHPLGDVTWRGKWLIFCAFCAFLRLNCFF
jgi:hypothetical protein